MFLITIQELRNNYLKYNQQYVCLEGNYDGNMLYENESLDGILIDKDANFHSQLDGLLMKINKNGYKGRLRLVGKVGVSMTPVLNVGQILMVEILDEKGMVLDKVLVDENSIPKELRGQILK